MLPHYASVIWAVLADTSIVRELGVKPSTGRGLAEVQSRGTSHLVQAVDVLGRPVVVFGRLLRLARIRDEEWIENSTIDNPQEFIAQLKSAGLPADAITFRGTFDDPSIDLHVVAEIENDAVINVADYDRWWNSLPQESRKNVRRAAKRGVQLRTVDLDDQLARDIKRIYDELPIRQGKRFWHYGKDLEAVARENATYGGRSEILGAYVNDELIGYMKWVYVGKTARIMQILSLSAHQDKRPMNALIAKAVEICHARKIDYLVYGKFSYDWKGDDSMTEFKRRMGFEQFSYPRYYVPFNRRGSVLLYLGLHKGFMWVLPRPLVTALRSFRARWLSYRGRPLNRN